MMIIMIIIIKNTRIKCISGVEAILFCPLVSYMISSSLPNVCQTLTTPVYDIL